MSKKYIDEQEAKIAWYRELGATSKRAAIAIDLVFDRIPAADVEEVKHGEWILEREPNGEPYCFHCSVCDDDFHYISIVTKYPYCPNCGAKMDGKGNKGEGE